MNSTLNGSTVKRLFAGRTAQRTAQRAAVLSAGAAGALLVLAPTAAHANVGWGGTITPGGTACVQQYAGYAARAEGTATRNGARFTVYGNGAQLYGTVNTTGGFAAEFRTAWGNFRGPGYYQVCATNRNATNTLVNIRILVDGEF